MKKIAIIVGTIFVVLGISAAAFFGIQYYRAKNDPIANIIKGALDLRVSESVQTSKMEYKDAFAELFKTSLQNNLKENADSEEEASLYPLAIETIANKINYKSENKLVLDGNRNDFGFSSDFSIKYGKEKIFAVELASDFSDVYLAIPELIENGFVVNVPELTSYQSENKNNKFDVKPYLKILFDEEVPKQSVATYYKIIKGFLNEDRFETLGDEDIVLDGEKTIKTKAYRIKFSSEDSDELLSIILKNLSKDTTTINFIEGKIDKIFDYYIESKDYQITGANLEDIESKRSEIKNGISKLKDNKLDKKKLLYLIFKGDIPFKQEQEKLADTNFDNEIIINLDKNNKIRRIKNISDSLLVKVEKETIFTKIGKEVDEKPILNLSNAERIDVEISKVDFISKYGAELIDNVSENILGGRAVEDMVSDLVKAVKLSDDVDDETKESVLEKLGNAVEETRKSLNFLKFFIG